MRRGVEMGFRWVLFAVLVSVLAMGTSVLADIDPESSSTDAISIKHNAPDSVKCTTKNRCHNMTLKCPKSCPHVTPAHGTLACYLDCTTKCKPCCKHRKPDCKGYGAVCYDPRFIGGDRIMYYFHGKKNADFCLVSDRNLHINAHFIGKRPEGRTRDYTWVQSLGLMFRQHKLTVGVKKVSTWDDQVDQLFASYDGMDIQIPRVEGAIWTSTDEEVIIERLAVSNSAYLVIKGLIEISLTAVPITEKESRVHNYQITNDDCFAHLEVQFTFIRLSPSVNGVLGQTYQPGYHNPVKRGVPMPIMGGDEKFITSSLLSADCSVSQFGVDAIVSTVHSGSSLLTMPTDCKSSGSGILCRR